MAEDHTKLQDCGCRCSWNSLPHRLHLHHAALIRQSVKQRCNQGPFTPSHSLFFPFPSGRRYSSLRACAIRFKNSFFPAIVRYEHTSQMLRMSFWSPNLHYWGRYTFSVVATLYSVFSFLSHLYQLLYSCIVWFAWRARKTTFFTVSQYTWQQQTNTKYTDHFFLEKSYSPQDNIYNFDRFTAN